MKINTNTGVFFSRIWNKKLTDDWENLIISFILREEMWIYVFLNKVHLLKFRMRESRMSTVPDYLN